MCPLEMLLPQQGEAGIHGGGIVSRPSAALYFRQGDIDTATGSIGSVGRDGIDHIRDGQDLCFVNDLIAFQTIGVAGTVNPLMMLNNHFLDRPGEVRFLQYLETSLGMGFYDSEFAFGQSAGSIQNLGRDRYLTDIMDRRAQFQPFQLETVPSQFSANRNGKRRHIDLMTAGIGIALFNRGRNRPHRPIAESSRLE